RSHPIFSQVLRSQHCRGKLAKAVALDSGCGICANARVRAQALAVAPLMDSASFLRAVNCLWRRTGLCPNVVAVLLLQRTLWNPTSARSGGVFGSDAAFPGQLPKTACNSHRSRNGWHLSSCFQLHFHLACPTSLFQGSLVQLAHSHCA